MLVGFNPVNRARNAVLEGWGKTFREVAIALEELSQKQPHQYFIINPVVGPEPITGSTRMKGGTATKIILDTLFAVSYGWILPCLFSVLTNCRCIKLAC